MRQKVLSRAELEQILRAIPQSRVGVLGDFCLDAYWYADMTRSSLSRETPHFPVQVVREAFSPGGAGNVMMNLAALNLSGVVPICVLGRDWRGQVLGGLMEQAGASMDYVLFDPERSTPGYCKPILQGYSEAAQEGARIDFVNTSPLGEAAEDWVLAALDKAIREMDVLAVCDQLDHGIISKRVRGRLEDLGDKGRLIVVDSRDHLAEYRQVMVKPNELEALVQAEKNPPATPRGLEQYDSLIRKLYAQTRKPIVITLGERGALYFDGEGLTHAPSKRVPPPIDIVGAGDSFLAAFCAALAAGTEGGSAIAFANLASGVTIQKLNTTGTASPDEILDWHAKEIA